MEPEPEAGPSEGLPPAWRHSRVALCIGIDAYGGANTLPNCVNDATDMGACAASMGIQTVHVLKDATRGEILKQLRFMRDEEIRRGSLVLFYFSGHGQEHEGVTYLLPRGMDSYAKDDLETEAVSLNVVLKTLNSRAEGTANLLFLDCCRANDLDTTFKGTKAAGGGGSKGMIGKDIRAKKDAQYLIGLACDPGTVALANPNARNSRYTAALLKQLPVVGQPLEVSMRKVCAEVFEQTEQRQKPWVNASLTVPVVLVAGETAEQRAIRERLEVERQAKLTAQQELDTLAAETDQKDQELAAARAQIAELEQSAALAKGAVLHVVGAGEVRVNGYYKENGATNAITRSRVLSSL
jgi:uncharacterized caspase-like protein